MLNNKKLLKNSNELTKTGLTLSLGSSLTKDNAYSQQAINNISSKLPIVGSIQGIASVVESLKLLDPRKKKKY